MKFVVGKNERNPVKNLPRPRFVHHETHMEGPRRELGTPAVGGRGEQLDKNSQTVLVINKLIIR